MSFSKTELRDLAICWLVLAACLSIGVFFNRTEDPWSTVFMNFLAVLLITLVAMATGFIVHELAHKFAAQRYGFWAEFRIWKPGMIISVATSLLSFGTFIFFAPGAVRMMAYRPLTERENGVISTWGPAANIVMALLFYFIYFFRHAMPLSGDFTWNVQVLGQTFKSYPLNVFTLGGRLGFQLNLWLAAFNLIPLGPLDGASIFRWSKVVWGILVAVAWGLLLLSSFGVLPL